MEIVLSSCPQHRVDVKIKWICQVKEAALLYTGIIKGPSICSLVTCILSATLSYGQRQEGQREEGTNKINARHSTNNI